MSGIEAFVRLFAPHVCLGCGAEEDRLLCEGCAASIAVVPSRCYRCKAVTDDYTVCATCRSKTPLRQVIVLTHYTGMPKELIHKMKYERARAGIAEAAQLLGPQLVYLPADAMLTHVPTASSRVRQRGYDHARLLACHLATTSGYPYGTALARVGQAHQVGAKRAERLRQLRGAFRPVHLQLVQGKHVVLVDDVLTTGATLETAARELKRAGAATVSAIVFAQA